jgi:hypothetical protein
MIISEVWQRLGDRGCPPIGDSMGGRWERRGDQSAHPRYHRWLRGAPSASWGESQFRHRKRQELP